MPRSKGTLGLYYALLTGLLAGCAGASGPEAGQSVSATPTGSAPAQEPAVQPGWQALEWQGLSVSIPPGAEWRQEPVSEQHIPGVELLAAASVVYPQAFAPVERPYGPAFATYRFAGALDEWLKQERERAPSTNPIAEASVREVIVAGLPALAYRPSHGLPQAEYYALKLNGQTLLKIISDNAELELYNQVIRQLRRAG